MFNMGMTEMLIIAAIALVVIGPAKLPGLARAIGKGLTEFRKAVGDFKGTVSEEFTEFKKTADPNIQDLAKMADNLKNIHTPKNIEDYLSTAADVLEGAEKTTDEEKMNGDKITDEDYSEVEDDSPGADNQIIGAETTNDNKAPDDAKASSKS